MELTEHILKILKEGEEIDSLKLAEVLHVPHQKAIGAIKSLETLGDVINVVKSNSKLWSTTDEGNLLAKNGSHEARLFEFLAEGKSIEEIKRDFPSSAVAISAALRNKWIKKEGNNLIPCTKEIVDNVQRDLQAIQDGLTNSISENAKSEYKKRKLIKEADMTIFKVAKGKDFSTSISKQETELTKDMIESGKWKDKSFKAFNFKAKGKIEHRSGFLHPLLQLRSEFRQIFLEMGFTEMPTNNYIESAFWNFDALFQPQQHPARDAQDTFYISNPERTISVPQDYLQRVRKVHEKGDYGSTGYRSSWSYDESMKNLLRTHTTAVSARLLHKLAQEGFKPAKYFSIDKVYRNETLDATHLAEFYQVEGVIADYNLSMKHLMGVFSAFFEKIGIRNIRFKSTYNPYTEPSMEIYSFHDGLKKWVEVGNSGYFRPEMLRPMGLPEHVTVAGWGLSLERPAMIMFGINNIRELVGPRVKMELIMENPICTIDKFQRNLRKKEKSSCPLESLRLRQESILMQLQALDAQISKVISERGISNKLNSSVTNIKGIENNGLPLDIVLYADPKRPPYSLLAIATYLFHSFNVTLCVHKHSSLEESETNLLSFWDCINSQIRSNNHSLPFLSLRLVWRSQKEFIGTVDPSMSISPLNAVQVSTEANIGRLFCRLLDCHRGKAPYHTLYEGSNSMEVIENIDQTLNECQQLVSSGNNRNVSNSLQKLNGRLKPNSFICGSKEPTLADLIFLSTLRQLEAFENISNFAQVDQWIQTCQKHVFTSLVL